MRLSFTSLLVLLLLQQTRAITAPYQVSIRSNSPSVIGPVASSGASKQICNGVVIRDKYILTTASCLFVQDMQTRLSRFINPGEIFVIGGNISINQTDYGDEARGSLRRNVVSVIPNGRFNATTGNHDIALLKLDRSLLPLSNNTASPVRWIELEQQHQRSHPSQQQPPLAAGAVSPVSPAQQHQPTAVPTNNKVNENCFINIYNNSVGLFDYPYTVVRNVSFFDKWVCDAQRGPIAPGQVAVERYGSCVEYRFSNLQSCWLDANSLRRSEERGSALVCNFKLVAILAEINPPSNPQSCTSIKRTTAYYTMVAPYYDWIVSEIGYLYAPPSAHLPPGPTGTPTPAGGNPVTPLQIPSGPAPPISSWGDQQIAATTTSAGKAKSTATSSISTGMVFELILFNLFVPFAFVHRFHH